MGGRRRSASASDSDSSTSSSSSSSSESGSSSSSGSSSGSASASGSRSAASSSSEERRRRRDKRRRRKKIDVARLQRQLQHVERLQLLQRRAAAARALAGASPAKEADPPAALPPPPPPPERRRKRKAERKERRKKKRDKKKRDKPKNPKDKHKHKKRAQASLSEPEEEKTDKPPAKVKSVRPVKRPPQTPPSPSSEDQYRVEENARKRKLPPERGNGPPLYRNEKGYDDDCRERYAKEKYSDDKNFDQDRRYVDRPESAYQSEGRLHRKYSENYSNRPQNRNRNEFQNIRENRNLGYDQKRPRFDKDVPDDGYDNDQKKYSNYDKHDKYKRNENFKSRNDDIREHRRYSPHRNDKEHEDHGDNMGYSKPHRNVYEQRDYSYNRRKDDNGTNKKDFKEADSRRNNRECDGKNENYSQGHGKNERRYEKRFSDEPEVHHAKESIPSTTGRNEKFQRTDDRERFNSKDRRNSSCNLERRDASRGNRRSSPSHKGKDENQSYEWGKKEKKPAENAGSEKAPKDKPNFALSGKLTEETNMVNGVVIKYSEPPEGKQPKRRWRFYPFKGDKALPILYLHRQSFFLLGRDRTIADIPLDHPSISKQHAVLQYRLVPFKRDDGSTGKRVRPYIIDLGSSNGTFVNNVQIEPSKYVELLERDVVKFGFSQREYVLLHENSKDDGDMDDDDVKPTIKLEDIKKIIKQEAEN